MRNTVAPALLVASFQVCLAVQAGEPSLAERLETLVPRAAGVARVEVTDIQEVDSRPGDGPLYLDVRFRILRSSGATRDRVHIVKAHGGHRGANSPEFKPYGPVKLDTFKKGHRYGVAFSSQYDWTRCPQGVVNAWPGRDVPDVLDEAIRRDHYAHRPQYDPGSGLTHGYLTGKDKHGWRARMERDGTLLWEVSLPGEKFEGERLEGDWGLLHRRQWSSGLGHADENRSGRFLLAETAADLEKANRYALPAGKHRLTYALDADSGKTAAVWVSRPDVGATSSPSVVRYFDLKTGGLRREERYDLLETGGLAAGAKQERWLRKLVRTYAPGADTPETEEVFGWTGSPEGGGYAPVNKPSGKQQVP